MSNPRGHGSGPGAGLTTERMIDWGLSALAVLLALFVLLQQGQQPESPAVDVAAVRALEEYGRVVDASDHYPESIRALIGLDDEDGAEPLAVMNKARADLRRGGVSTKVWIVWAAMSISFGVDEPALEELGELARVKSVMAEWEQTLRALVRLADGKPVDDIRRLNARLKDAGASRWLTTRVTYKQALNLGDEEVAAASANASQAMAISAVDVTMTDWFIKVALVLLGFILLLAGPPIRRSLVRRGFTGLGPPLTPFRADRNQRVIAAWFLLSFLLSSGVALVLMAIYGSSPRAYALLSAVSSGLNALAAVALITLFARPRSDARPLGRVVGLSIRAVPGRLPGLVVWAVLGLAFVTFLTVAAQILNIDVLAPTSNDLQPSLMALLQDGSTPTFLILTIGACVFAPLGEELLFRGFLYRNLRTTMGPTGSMFLSGLIFAAIHVSPAHLIPLTALGMGLAALYEWSGSLWVPVAVHSAWNLLQLISAYAIYHAL